MRIMMRLYFLLPIVLLVFMLDGAEQKPLLSPSTTKQRVQNHTEQETLLSPPSSPGMRQVVLARERTQSAPVVTARQYYARVAQKQTEREKQQKLNAFFAAKRSRGDTKESVVASSSQLPPQPPHPRPVRQPERFTFAPVRTAQAYFVQGMSPLLISPIDSPVGTRNTQQEPPAVQQMRDAPQTRADGATQTCCADCCDCSCNSARRNCENLCACCKLVGAGTLSVYLCSYFCSYITSLCSH